MSDLTYRPAALVAEPEAQGENDEGSKQKEGEFECPECHRHFDTQRGMSRHRNAMHGKPATKGKKGKAGKAVKKDLAVSRARTIAGGDPGLGGQQYALLKIVFPEGMIPAKAFKQAAEWLVEADRLAKIK